MSLKQTIESVFTDVPYPGDGNITRCPYHCAECLAVAKFFKGRSWQGNTVEELREHHTALALFTPEAFHYFLPAFMLASIDGYDKFDVIPDSVRSHFEYLREHREYFAVRMSQFTLEQRKAIIGFLIFMESKGAGSSEDAISLLSEVPEEGG